MANYLASLSTVAKLSLSSVRFHAAAICTFLGRLGGGQICQRPLLNDGARGIALSESHAPRRVLAWRLSGFERS